MSESALAIPMVSDVGRVLRSRLKQRRFRTQADGGERCRQSIWSGPVVLSAPYGAAFS